VVANSASTGFRRKQAGNRGRTCANHAGRLRLQLAALDTAQTVEDMNVPLDIGRPEVDVHRLLPSQEPRHLPLAADLGRYTATR
jgi:hypothetical protein